MSALLWFTGIVIGAVALLVVLLSIVEKRTGRKLGVTPRTRVEFDDIRIKCRHGNGVIEEVEWSDLQAAIVRTGNGEPYWLLYGTDGGCLVPVYCEGARDLLLRLQQLPAFDNRTFVLSLGDIRGQDFKCWKRRI